MSNITQERKYRNIASRIEKTIMDLLMDEGLDMKMVNPMDKHLIDQLVQVQNASLDVSIQFEDRIKENM